MLTLALSLVGLAIGNRQPPGRSRALAVRLARRLVATPLAVFGALSVVAAPNHAVDPGWSTHDQIHLVTGSIWLIGLCLVGIVLTWIPLARGERWAWWTLVALGLAVFAGPTVTAWVYAPAGLLGSVDLMGTAILASTYATGLGITRRQLRGR